MAERRSDDAKMYGLLEEMLGSAERRDREAVLKLNRSLEPLILKRYRTLKDSLGREYDNCRQSCILPFTTLPSQYDAFMADAKKRFSKLKKPSGRFRQ